MSGDEGLRVLVAARLSQPKKQRKGKDSPRREGIGIETQDEEAREHAADEGMTVVGTAADIKSGTVAPWDRKELKKWTTEPAKLATYDAILAYSMDRLSRGKQDDFTRIENWALENGKQLIVIEEETRYPSRNNHEIDEWDRAKRSARKEWEKIRERLARMQRAILDRGGVIGTPPWGYEITGEDYEKRYSATPEVRRLAPLLFQKVADFEPRIDVARWMARETGTEWNTETIARIIANPVYRGEYTVVMKATEKYPRKPYSIPCDAVVDEALWNKANDVAKMKFTSMTGGGKPARKLAGVAMCPVCALRGEASKVYRLNEWRYRCHGHGASTTRKGCGNVISTPGVEWLLERFMTGNHREVRSMRQVAVTDWHAALSAARRTRRNLDDESPDYDQRHAELTAEVKRLEAERDAHKGDRPRVETYGTGQTYAQRWAELDEAGQREWLRRSGVLAYVQEGEMDAFAVLAAVSGERAVWLRVLDADGQPTGDYTNGGSDGFGWAKLLTDEASSASMLVTWGLDF